MADEVQPTLDQVSLTSPPIKTALVLSDAQRPVIVRLRDVEKTYDIGTPRETKALRGVNLDITMSEVVVIFGASGSGKSTLLNILAGLDTPTKGSVEMDGKDLAKMKPKDLALYHQYKVGMVFQAYNLVDTFTVLQNISMPARLAGFKRSDYGARASDLLKQFGLEKLKDKLPSECSGGQQQRVGIMRAFMNRPAFIIADEPTGNLDSIQSQRIMRLFKNLNEETNTTMLIVTHDPSLFEIADRVVHVLDGKITKQTILTKKALVDEKTAGVPIEYKYRGEDLQALIDAFGGSKTEAKGTAEQIIETKKAELETQRQKVNEESRVVEAKRQQILQKEAELETARKEFEKQIQQRIAAARAAIASERARLSTEVPAAAQAQQQQMEREKRIQVALQHITKDQEFIAQEKQRLEELRRKEEVDQNALEQQREELKQARADFAKEVSDRIVAARASIAQEKKRLVEEAAQGREIQVTEAEREMRIQAALKKIATQEDRIKEEQRRLLEAQTQTADEQKMLSQEKKRLASATQKVAVAEEALQEARVKFEKEMQLRLSLATHIIDHEKEQLETERQQQAQEQKQRAQTMERRINAARNIIDQEATMVQAEHRMLEEERQKQEELARQLAEERFKLQEERRRLSLVQRKAEGRRRGPGAHDELSAFETLLSERSLLSRVDQQVLGVLTTILTEQQQFSLKRAQILRLIEIVVLRLYEVVGQTEMQQMLDRSFARGGVGLYRQAAEHLAAEIEAMIQLGKLALRGEDEE